MTDGNSILLNNYISLAWPDRFFPFFFGEKSGLAMRDYNYIVSCSQTLCHRALIDL